MIESHIGAVLETTIREEKDSALVFGLKGLWGQEPAPAFMIIYVFFIDDHFSLP
jgi:hypothetical protein